MGRITVSQIRIGAALLGFGCLTAAQSLLLASREPFRPLALFLVGIGLLLPSLAAGASSLQASVLTAGDSVLSSRRLFAWVLALLALAVSLSASGSAPWVQVVLWMLTTAAAVWAVLGGDQFTSQGSSPPLHRDGGWGLRIKSFARPYLPDILIVAGLMLAAAAFQALTPTPTIALPEHAAQLRAAQSGGALLVLYPEGGVLYIRLVQLTTVDVAGLQRLSAVFAVLAVPAVYLLGRLLDGRWTGFFAAGFTVVGLWTLALGKAGTVFSPLVLCSALFVAALLWAQASQHRRAYAAVGVTFALGWLMSPLFLTLGLLLPIQAFLQYADSRQRQAAFKSFRRWRALAAFMAGLAPLYAALLVAAAIALPILANQPNAFPTRTLPDDYTSQIGLSPALVSADALSSGLLLFNLTSDPSPLHGIINRPVFAPFTAAAFVIGLLAWAFRIRHMRRGADLLLPAALGIALLPVAIAIAPPLRYPDLQRAALALPIATTFAAWGVNRIVRPLQTPWGSRGKTLVISLFLLMLLALAYDAYQHYTHVSLPAYEHAAPMENQLYGGP